MVIKYQISKTRREAFTVRVSAPLKAQIEEVAAALGWSQTRLVQRCLQRYLKHYLQQELDDHAEQKRKH